MRTIGVVFCLLLGAASAWAGLVLVKDGRAQSVIITTEKPSATAQHAAEELQHFIELISGAKLAIRTDAVPLLDGETAILVGRSKFTAGMTLPAGDNLMHDREAFVIKTMGTRLVLAGNEDGGYHGTEYAVYDLLERLGCRWYYPGDYGQVVPNKATIEVPVLNVEERPSFIMRNVWTSGWAAGTEDYGIWLLRNKGTAHDQFAFPGDGSIANLAPPAKYAKQFPEIYAMSKDGKRPDETAEPSWTMLCTSNPKTVEIAAQTVRDFFREHPEANSYAFSPPDNNAMCYCPDCTARMHDFQSYAGYESISDPLFNFANNVAWAIKKDFPDKKIVAMSYYSRVTPPEGLEKPWCDNIIVMSAQLWVSAVRPIGTPDDVFALRQKRTMDAWARQTKTMMIYDYDPHADLSRMPYWRPRAIAQDMKRYFKDYGVIGFATEGQPAYFRTGLNYYVRARLMWDINADVDMLLNDYYTSFFGPAAAPMQRFHEEIERMLQTTPDHLGWRSNYYDWSPTFPPARVAALGKLLDQAEAKANTPEITKRLSLYRLLHTYMTTYLNTYTLDSQGQYAAALAECEKLPGLIDKSQALQAGLLPPDPQWVLNEGGGYASLHTYLALQAERTDAKKGELLGLAPVMGQFRTDPKDVGIFEQWQRPEVAAALKWSPIDLRKEWGLNGFRDAEKYGYDSFGWYRVAFPVKTTAVRAHLVVPRYHAKKLWIWVNGALVFSPTTPLVKTADAQTQKNAFVFSKGGNIWIDFDIQDYLKPGAENVFTFRMVGSSVSTLQRGLSARPYVWAPVQ